jgi:hypothetical protein
MALTRNKARTYTAPTLGSLPLTTAAVVFEGAAIGIDAATGKARSVVAGDLFAGFARWQASSVQDVTGANPTTVNLVAAGEVTLTVAGVVSTSVGASVFASDDDTFSLSGSTVVGSIVRVPIAGQAVVAFRAGVPSLSSAEITLLKGLANGTGADVAADFLGLFGAVVFDAGSGNVAGMLRFVVNVPDSVIAGEMIRNGGTDVHSATITGASTDGEVIPVGTAGVDITSVWGGFAAGTAQTISADATVTVNELVCWTFSAADEVNGVRINIAQRAGASGRYLDVVCVGKARA